MTVRNGMFVWEHTYVCTHVMTMTNHACIKCGVPACVGNTPDFGNVQHELPW